MDKSGLRREVMTKYTLNITRSLTIIIFFSLLIFLASLNTSDVSATEEDSESRVQQKEQELSIVTTRIGVLEGYIKFEKAWEKKLKTGLGKIAMVQDANSDLGQTIRFLASAVSEGASEDVIKNKIDKVNSIIEPYFRIDEKGDLYFGSALQMAAVQTQFAPSGVPAMTAEGAKSVLTEIMSHNRDYMTKNEKELDELRSREKALRSDLESLEEERREREGTESASVSERSELEALKRRLKFIEERIEGRVWILEQYNEKELEMQLHIAFAKKAIAQYRDVMTTMSLFTWELSSAESVRQSIKGVRSATSKLSDAYDEYNSAIDYSSDAADRICDYASGLESDPPPSPEQVSKWSGESKALLDKAVLSIVESRANAALLKNSLVSSVSGLESRLSPLGRILDNRDTYLNLFSKLGEVRSNLQNVKKDIQRAKEIEEEMKSLIMMSRIVPVAALDEELSSIKRDANALRVKYPDSQSGLEQEIDLINQRIETADMRIGQTIMPGAPPVVPDLASQAEEYLNKLGETDFSAIGESKISEAETMVSDGNEAITDAQEALAASDLDSEKSDESIERGRECYTSLTGAEHEIAEGDTLEEKVNALAARMDKAEQEFDSLMELNGEINGLIEKMKVRIARAQTIKMLTEEIITEAGNAQVSPVKISSDEYKGIKDLVTLVESHITKLKKAYIMLNRASEEASKMRDEICGYVEKAGSPPFPSHKEIETWKAESQDRIFEVGVALKVAANEVDTQTEEIASRTPELKSKMELLEKKKSLLLAGKKVLSDIKTLKTDMNKEISEAQKIKQSIDSMNKEFGNRFKVLSKEVYDLDNLAKSYLPLAKSEQLKQKIYSLLDRIETMRKRTDNMPLLKVPDIPEFKDSTLVEAHPDELMSNNAKKIAEIDSLLSRGKQVLSDAEFVEHGISLVAIQNAPYAFEKANECHSSLIEAAKREYYIVRVSGKGYIPHFSGGSFIKEGFKDIKVKVDPASGITIESEIERIRNEWSKPPNCERNIIDRMALSEGPPRFWTDGPEVTRRAGPLSAREAEKQPLDEEWKTVGDDGPPFCELLETFCGKSCVGAEGPSAETAGPPGGVRTAVNADALDPDTDPEVARMIQEWLSIAEPPENAVPGNNFYYDRFGRKMGSGGGMRTIGSHETVQYGAGATPEAKVWSDLRTRLDSVNHCTLEEYVVARLESRSIANCRGRYTSVKPLKGKSLEEAKDEVSKKGLKYEVATGSAADSKESEGNVEKQEPGSDKHLKRGQTLKLVVYGPYVPPKVTVPRVTEMKFDDAVAKLDRQGFEFERTDVQNTLSEDKNLTVKAQDPSANKKAEKGSAVKLEVYGLYSYFNDALDALGTCDAEKVRGFVAKMPAGGEKTEIEKKYKELTVHLREIEHGTEDAREEFGNECYAEAIGTLEGLLSSARCPDERETIEGLITEYEDGSKTKRDELKGLTDKAREEYEDECFDKALDSLGEALASTQCEVSRQKIDKLAQKVRADKDKKTAAINSMTGQAMTHFEKGCYADALHVMNKVVGNLRCESSRKKAEGLIAKIETKRAAVSKRMDAALQNFEKGCFDDAASILSGLKEEIKCEKQASEIDKLIKKVEGKRAQLNKKMSDALSKFESGCYDEAESVLQGVMGEVSCEKSRPRIEGLITQCRQKRNSLRAEMNTAMNKYEAGEYADSKNILEGLLRKPICEPQRTKVEGLIARMTPVVEPPLMPDLRGMNVDDAASAVRNLGMNPGVKKDKSPSNQNDEHRVYAQRPTVNTKVQPGGAVDIYAYGSFEVIDVREESVGKFAGRWKCRNTDQGGSDIPGTVIMTQQGNEVTVKAVLGEVVLYTYNGTVRGNTLTLRAVDQDWTYESTSTLSADGKSMSVRWRKISSSGGPPRNGLQQCSKVGAGDRVDTGGSFVGSWTGNAHIKLMSSDRSYKELTYVLNFSIDRGNNARGTIAYQEEQDVVSLSGAISGSGLRMTGQEQFGKIELKGSLSGRNANGSFGITTQDIECILRSRSDQEAYNCPLKVYEGSWTAQKR
jgi:beta-lactam-binding protein with PASTA domain